MFITNTYENLLNMFYSSIWHVQWILLLVDGNTFEFTGFAQTFPFLLSNLLDCGVHSGFDAASYIC